MTVREARAADIGRVHELFVEYANWLGVDLCFQGFDQELAALPGGYARPDGVLLVAEAAGEIVGCVGVRRLDESTCEMKRLYVVPARQGQGLGRHLAEVAIGAARELGYRTMRLDTLSRMQGAVALYGSLGFRATAAYYNNPLPDVRYFELKL